MKTKIRIACALATALGLAAPAAAAPVFVSAQLTLTLPGLALIHFGGGGTIDVTGGSYTLPANLISVAGPVTVPVTSSSAVTSLQAVGIQNLAASLSLGGATAQAPGDVCVPSTGQACVAGGGIGGAMPLSGLVNVQIIPSIVTFPLDLFVLRVGQGGAVNSPFTANAAVWTTGTASVNLGFNAISSQGGTTVGGGLTLVTATYIQACGNLLPLLGRLTLTPTVPEPSVWLLLGAGALGLGVAFRRS